MLFLCRGPTSPIFVDTKYPCQKCMHVSPFLSFSLYVRFYTLILSTIRCDQHKWFVTELWAFRSVASWQLLTYLHQKPELDFTYTNVQITFSSIVDTFISRHKHRNKLYIVQKKNTHTYTHLNLRQKKFTERLNSNEWENVFLFDFIKDRKKKSKFFDMKILFT